MMNGIKDAMYNANVAISGAFRKVFKKKEGPSKISRSRKKRAIFICLSLSIAIFNFLFFWVQINFESILMAFRTVGAGGVEVYGFKNFAMLIDELKNPVSIMSEALKNTFIFFFFGLLIETPICFMFSFFLYKKIRGYKIFRYIFFLPNIISAVVLTTFVKILLGVDGPVVIIWEKLFGVMPLFFQDSSYALNTMLFYNLWSGFGLNIVLYMGAMSRIPDDVLEYARLDGVGFGREIVQFIIPLIWPTVATLLLLQVSGVFGASGPIFLFTKGAYGTYTLSYWIFAKTLENSSLEYASAVGLFFTFIGLPIVLLVRWITNRVEAIEY